AIDATRRESSMRMPRRFPLALAVFVAGASLAASLAAPERPADAPGAATAAKSDAATAARSETTNESQTTAAAGATSRPSVLVITLDTTRADHTSAYGYDRPTTPRLEEMARDGVRFDVAYAPMATTLPSHTTMFTGLLPRTHGTLKHGLVEDQKLPLLAEIMRNAGYRPAAFLSSFAGASRFGLARGFEVCDENFRGGEGKWDVHRWEGHSIQGDFSRRGDLTR